MATDGHQMLGEVALLEECLAAVGANVRAFAHVPHVVFLQQLAGAKLFAAFLCN
jgi:hypothetical protein